MLFSFRCQLCELRETGFQGPTELLLHLVVQLMEQPAAPHFPLSLMDEEPSPEPQESVNQSSPPLSPPQTVDPSDVANVGWSESLLDAPPLPPSCVIQRAVAVAREPPDPKVTTDRPAPPSRCGSKQSPLPVKQSLWHSVGVALVAFLRSDLIGRLRGWCHALLLPLLIMLRDHFGAPLDRLLGRVLADGLHRILTDRNIAEMVDVVTGTLL